MSPVKIIAVINIIIAYLINSLTRMINALNIIWYVKSKEYLNYLVITYN